LTSENHWKNSLFAQKTAPNASLRGLFADSLTR
jgi:hypothetical protein